MRALMTRIRRARTQEDGATAIVVVFFAIALFAAAALAVDYSSLTMERQRLHDHVDAAAHAGAYELPGNGANAANKARDMALDMDDTLTPDIDLWCVVKSVSGAPDSNQIPSTCDPGQALSGVRCNDKICAIPCSVTTGQCNAVRVADNKQVPFGFARVIGVNDGNTGSVTTLACKGSCGDESPNPLDVAIVADRTPSMSNADRQAMVQAIRDMLTTMDPALHYVTLGALHKSRTYNGCVTANTAGPPNNASDYTWQTYAKHGTWMPVPFSNDYLTSDKKVRAGSSLANALDCLHAQTDRGYYGTHLAASFKGGARYLLGEDGSNINAMPSGRPGTVRKVLIFETDGMPDEIIDTSFRSLTNNTDFGAGRNGACTQGPWGGGAGWCVKYSTTTAGATGCENLTKIATEAKARGITVITIGFGEAATGGCTITNRYVNAPQNYTGPLVKTSGTPVRDVLAAAASPDPATGAPSSVKSCATATEREAENTDGDFFFCAATGAEMQDIFKVAVQQVTTSIRFLEMP